MDPDEVLSEVTTLASHLHEHIDGEHRFGEDQLEQTDKLAEHIRDLDEWVSNGGFLPKKWEENCHGGLLRRAQLAQKVYDEAFEATESFEGEFGVHLTYLLGAILRNDKFQVLTANPELQEAFELFAHIFPKNHEVWDFIEVVEG